MSGLHLLNPMGLLLLAGLAPLVILYILKVRRRRQRVSSTWLWAQAQRDLRAKHPLRRLIAELPLVLQILALVALAIAVAGPTSLGRTIDEDHVAIVIDTSASMAARVGGPTGVRSRIDDAKHAASEMLSRLQPGADAMIIEAAREARMVAPLDRDPRRLQAAVASIATREVEGELVPAVALAADRLRSLGGRLRIVVITDGALAHEEALAVTGVPTQIVTVGDPEDNAAIVRVDVRSGVDGNTNREQVQTFAMIQSWAARPREAYVTLSIEGQNEPVASRRLRLQPGDKQPVTLTFEPHPSDRGQGLIVQLAPGDAFPNDDVAFGRVPASPRMPVVVSSDAPYSWTTRALEADPNIDLQRLTLGQLASVNVDPDALVVVEGGCPISVPGRDVLAIAPPTGSCFGVDVGPTVENPVVTSWESGEPRLRFLTLDGVHIAKASALGVRSAGGRLVRSSSTALVADASPPGRSVTLVGFDVGNSDWPLKASFVMFVRNVVELARMHRAQGATGPVRTGDAARVAVPPETKVAYFEGPLTPERELPARDGFTFLPPFDHTGLYRVRWDDPHIGSTEVAANLTSAAESDIRPRAATPEGAAVSIPGPARGIDTHNEWAGWFALLATIVLALDVWWMTRQPRSPGRWEHTTSMPRRAGR